MAETSDMKFLNNCRRQLDIYKADPRWNPSNARLETSALEAKLATGYPAAENVWAKNAPFEVEIDNRQAAYEKITPRVRAARRYLKSSGASEREIADANTVINKLLGVRVKAKKLDPNQPASEAEKTNSVSHRSYAAIPGNLTELKETFANISTYAPNEDNIKIVDFDALIDELENANNAVSQKFVDVFGAWNERDAKLYDDADSILEDFRDAKEYYKSLYEPGSPQYKAITAPDMRLINNSRNNKK